MTRLQSQQTATKFDNARKFSLETTLKDLPECKELTSKMVIAYKISKKFVLRGHLEAQMFMVRPLSDAQSKMRAEKRSLQYLPLRRTPFEC